MYMRKILQKHVKTTETYFYYFGSLAHPVVPKESVNKRTDYNTLFACLFVALFSIKDDFVYVDYKAFVLT